jgi:hypothetical protein
MHQQTHAANARSALRLGGLPSWAAAVLASMAEAEGPLVAQLRTALSSYADVEPPPPTVALDSQGDGDGTWSGWSRL